MIYVKNMASGYATLTKEILLKHKEYEVCIIIIIL